MKNIEGGTVKSSAVKKNEDYFIQVEDDGVGMSEQKIFDMLYSDKEMKSVALKNINRRLSVYLERN